MAKNGKICVEDLVKNVNNFHLSEANNGTKVAISMPFQRTVAALGISKSSLVRLLRPKNDKKARSTKKSGVGRKPKLDDFDLTLMRRVINEALKNRELINLKVLKSKLKEAGLVISKSTIWRQLKQSGFKFSRRGKDR